MSHSRQTEHYELPLYNGTDIINPLTDFNDANEAIDTALYNANQSASSANTKADSAVEAVAGYDTRITQAETKADTALTKNSDTEKMIANQFDPLKDGGYAIGDSVIYNDKLYTFINPHTGAWDAGDVVNQPITDAVKSTIAEGKAEIEQETQEAMAEIATQTQKVTATQKMIAEPFDPAVSYAEGRCVTYADKLYQFNDAHSGAWTGSDVTEIYVSKVIEEREKELKNVLIAEYDSQAGITWGAVWQGIKQHIVDTLGAGVYTCVVELGEGAHMAQYNVFKADTEFDATTLRTFSGNLRALTVSIDASDNVNCEYVDISAGGVTVTDHTSEVQSARHIRIFETR